MTLALQMGVLLLEIGLDEITLVVNLFVIWNVDAVLY